MRTKNSRSRAICGPSDVRYVTPESVDNIVTVASRGLWLKADANNWAIGILEADAPTSKGTYYVKIEKKDGSMSHATITLSNLYNKIVTSFSGENYVLYRRGAYKLHDYPTKPKPPIQQKTNVQKRASASKAQQTLKIKNRQP